MNIIKVENLKSVLGFTNKLEVNTGYKKDGVSHYNSIVILDADDIENENTLIKLRGVIIDALLIPKKYKFTFNDSKYYSGIKLNFKDSTVISYF